MIEIAIAFGLGMAVVHLLYWWTGNTIDKMADEARRGRDEMREMSEGAERIRQDIDRRFTQLQNAKRDLEEQHGAGAVERALREAAGKPTKLVVNDA